MSYRIEYEKTTAGKQRGTGLLIALCSLALLAALEFSGLKNKLWLWLFPGDAQVTASAFASFVEGVKAGEGAGEAITAFCREILDHAQ